MAIFGVTKSQAAQWAPSLIQGTWKPTAFEWLLRIDPLNDVILGSNRNDTLDTATEGTLVFGFKGNDRLGSTFNQTALIGGAGNDTLTTKVIVPMHGNDEVTGLAIQFGGTGNDTLKSTVTLQGGDVTVQDRTLSADVLADGGRGNDTITAVAKLAQPVFGSVTVSTHVLGGSGNDIITATANTQGALDDNVATNNVDGGAGNDRITALADTELSGFLATAINTVTGGDGNDIIDATARGVSNVTQRVTNSLSGGFGDDVLRAFSLTDSNSRAPVGINELWGDAGNDILEAIHSTDGENSVTNVTNRLEGGIGDDSLKADSTALGGFVTALNELNGGGGKDFLTARLVADAHGGPGPVGLNLYNVDNVLNGGIGDDRLEAYLSITSAPFMADASHAQNDLDGGFGDDVLVATVAPGSFGSSFLTGGAGHDQLTVVGGSDNILEGGNGNDKLAGGIGKDMLTGGTGNDTFIFNMALNATTNVDEITDYNVVADTIQLENAVFTALTSTGVLAAALFAANSTGLAGDAVSRILYETDTGNLYYDQDGNGATYAGIQFATLTPNLALTASDFLIT